MTATEARREACGLLVHMVDDWCVRYMEGEGKVPAEVRLELERMKDAFARVATVVDLPKPEGWSAGNPTVSPCHCQECTKRRREGEVREVVEGLRRTAVFYAGEEGHELAREDVYDVARDLLDKYDGWEEP